MELSKKYELNKWDIIRWMRTASVIYTPVLLLFITQIENNELDFKVLYALWVSISFDLIRRYLTNYANGG